MTDLVRCGGRFATEAGPTTEDSREHALMRAVLQEAMLDLRGSPTAVSHRERRQVAESAHAWMASRDMTWPFSFENVCGVLGFDPDALRCRLLRASPLAGQAVASGASPAVQELGMVRWARRVRLRGNRRRGPLRLRQSSRARAAARAARGRRDSDR